MNTLVPDVLALDCEAEASRICRRLRESLRELGRQGLVVAMSGGIDSSVSAALAVRAIGPQRVFGLMLPETDGAADSLAKATLLAARLGIRHAVKDITATLEAIGCYDERDAAIRAVFPAYGHGWKNKIAIAGGLEGRYNVFELVVQDPAGRVQRKRLQAAELFTIVAATNYKQRIRKTIEYFHADRLNYAVVGTPNRLEYDQGFFVKNGDGSADVKPIAHLYKTQVYALARHLALPQTICEAEPTTDTYSLQQGQDEFYFALPPAQMDYALWALNNGMSAAALGELIGLDPVRAERVYKDIQVKRNTTRYLHARPVLAFPVSEIHGL